MSNDQRLWYSSLNGAQWVPQAILPGGDTGPDPIAI